MVTPSHSPSWPSSPHVAFAGGGTGGHLFPALAVAEALEALIPDIRVTFFGTQRPIDDRILRETQHELVRQELPALSSKPWRWPRALLSYRRAMRMCRKRLAADRPDVVVGTGGLGSVPAVIEAKRLGLSTALINPDVVPGKANRYLASRVDTIFVHSAEALGHLPRSSRLIETGCPVREAFSTTGRDDAVHRFQLDGRRQTLLVTGASQGARTVNHAVLGNVEFLARQGGWQVLHLTGDADYDEVCRAYERHGVAGAVLPFTHHMPAALACADLVVTRGGASTLAEIAVVGVPSVIVPYPFHRDRHQEHNARQLVAQGAAMMIVDRIEPAKNGPALLNLLRSLMTDESRLGAMAASARRAGRTEAARDVAAHLARLVQPAPSVGHGETVEATS